MSNNRSLLIRVYEDDLFDGDYILNTTDPEEIRDILGPAKSVELKNYWWGAPFVHDGRHFGHFMLFMQGLVSSVLYLEYDLVGDVGEQVEQFLAAMKPEIIGKFEEYHLEDLEASVMWRWSTSDDQALTDIIADLWEERKFRKVTFDDAALVMAATMQMRLERLQEQLELASDLRWWLGESHLKFFNLSDEDIRKWSDRVDDLIHDLYRFESYRELLQMRMLGHSFIGVFNAEVQGGE